MIANEYIVTKKLYLDWYKENRKKGVQLKITILWVFIIIMLLGATVVYIFSPYEGNMTPWLALEVLFMVYSIYHLFFRRKLAASRLYDKLASQLGENWTKTVIFEKDAIRTVEGSGTFEVKYPYSEIVSVTSIGNEILIETDKKLVIRVYKDKFVEGDYARFKRFIETRVVNRCFLS